MFVPQDPCQVFTCLSDLCELVRFSSRNLSQAIVVSTTCFVIGRLPEFCVRPQISVKCQALLRFYHVRSPSSSKASVDLVHRPCVVWKSISSRDLSQAFADSVIWLRYCLVT